MTLELYRTYRLKVQIRREGFPSVRPNAEQVDGMVHDFEGGWEIGVTDSSIYVGEIAMIPNREGWPADAPNWIASGDLQKVHDRFYRRRHRRMVGK